MENKKLIILDGNAIIHRAYHALPPLTSKNGELTNAVYGFLLVFFKAIKDFKPNYVVATFDLPGPNFRHIKYKLYKANRQKAPDELYEQIPKVKEILKKFNIKIFEKQGFEADDIIGTISKTAGKKQIYPKIETIIVSGDADVLQLVDKNTKAYLLRKGVKDIVLYDEQKVKEKYEGLLPEQLIDFKSLRGDPSDNIPGVTGIGEKTAISLIKKFKSVDAIYEELRENGLEIKEVKEAIRKKLSQYKEQAYVSRTLAEIRKDVPIEFDLKNCRWEDLNKKEAIKVLQKYGFKSLIAKIEQNQEEEKPKEKILPKNPKNKKEIKNNLRLW